MSIFTDMGAAIEEAEYLADAEQCSQAIVRDGDHMTVLPYAEARGRELPIIRQVELLLGGSTWVRSNEPGTPARLADACLPTGLVRDHRWARPQCRCTDDEIIARAASRGDALAKRAIRAAGSGLALANMLGISVAQVSRWRNGKRPVSKKRVPELEAVVRGEV